MLSKFVSYFGIAGIFVLWISVGSSIILTKFDVLGKLPISYLGVYDESKYIFNIGLITASTLLLIFMYNVGRNVKFSKLFVVIFILGQLCQIIVAITPYNSPTIIKPIHVISAFMLAFTLPLSMYFFKKSPGIGGQLKHTTSRLLKLELLAFTAGIGWFVIASSAGALAEIITAVVFDIWILVISLIILKAERLQKS